MSHQLFAVRTTLSQAVAKSSLPILLLLGCASKDVADAKVSFTDTQTSSHRSHSPNEVAPADCGGSRRPLAIDPVLGCYESVRVAQHVRVAREAVELSQMLFPDSRSRLRMNRFDSGLPTPKERQLGSALVRCYMVCVEASVKGASGKNDEANALGLSRKHYAARLSMLEEFLTGGMSFGIYTAQMGMLDGQLRAGVFYYNDDSVERLPSVRR